MSQIKRKVKTLLHNPGGVKRKYDMILSFLMRRAPLPMHHEDYNEHWNYFSFRDKTVLDLGADYGSTAWFFGRKGAIKVIAVEGDKRLFEKLQEYARRHPFIVPIELFISSKEEIMRLISKYSPDIVKIDIEGTEKILVEFSKDDLNMVDRWMIETHAPVISQTLTEKFTDAGFSVRQIQQSEVQHILIIERRGKN